MNAGVFIFRNVKKIKAHILFGLIHRRVRFMNVSKEERKRKILEEFNPNEFLDPFGRRKQEAVDKAHRIKPEILDFFLRAMKDIRSKKGTP